MQKKQGATDDLHKMVDCTPGSLYWKDRCGRYLGCNHFMVRTAGLMSEEEIIGKTDQELWPYQAEQLSRNDQQVMQSGLTICAEETVNVNGKLMHFIGVKAPLKNARGDIIGVIGNSLDITELKETQAQLQREKQYAEADNYAKSEFIANMSHDIRTPLSGIIGLTEILISSLKDSAIVKFAKDAHNAANQLMQLLNEILEVSDIDAGNITDQQQLFNLTSVIKSLKELMAPSAEYKGITLCIQQKTQIPSMLYGYRILLHRVLLNLVSNAIKFTAKGSVTLTTTVVKQNAEEVHVHFYVADTGMGIPPDKIKQIFEPFKRLTPSYENKYQGTGLGLYTVKKFLDIMQGTLNVTSRVDQGSIFEFTLPFKVVETPVISPSLTDASISAPLFSSGECRSFSRLSSNDSSQYLYRALVVEDDTTAQIVSRVQLNKQNCYVDIVDSSNEAVRCFKERDYHLILMDIGLPDKSGIETSKIFRAHEKKHDKIRTPIIALTAHVTHKDQKMCLSAGMDYILQKPFSQQLAEKIAEMYLTPHHIEL